ncbi:MAG: YafY family transcriptional regulator [Anaerolineae bacterium]|nr:YafY family transcriptional regulator [Anaerolineae bacterium]
MSTTATRLLHLIQLLQYQPNQKAADLAGKLGISVRTLHRYFGMLDEMGIPIYSERGPSGGFSLVRGYKMPPLMLTPDEATAVCLGTNLMTEMWGTLYRQPARAALTKLENLLPDEQRQEVDWARRTLLATGFQRSNTEETVSQLELLRQAARERQAVRMTYYGSSQPQATQRVIEPYGLVHRSGWWYVIGFCRLRQALRSFRLDRMEALQLLPETFQPPTNFDIREHADMLLPPAQRFTCRLRFIPEGAQVALSNRSAWDDLTEEADGSIIVTLTAPTLEWAASTALAFSPIVVALEPEELRSTVAEWASAILSYYPKEDK